jgi:hypothetical protein
MYSEDHRLRTGQMFDDVIEAHEVEAVSFVVHFLNWLSLDREKPSHVLRGLRGDFDPFWVFPTLFGGGLKERTEAEAVALRIPIRTGDSVHGGTFPFRRGALGRQFRTGYR